NREDETKHEKRKRTGGPSCARVGAVRAVSGENGMAGGICAGRRNAGRRTGRRRNAGRKAGGRSFGRTRSFYLPAGGPGLSALCGGPGRGCVSFGLQLAVPGAGGAGGAFHVLPAVLLRK